MLVSRIISYPKQLNVRLRMIWKAESMVLKDKKRFSLDNIFIRTNKYEDKYIRSYNLAYDKNWNENLQLVRECEKV